MFFIFLNGKYKIFYDIIIQNIINILNNNNKYSIQYETNVPDSEQALINIKKKFHKTKRISCYFQHKQDLIKNINLLII